MSAHTLVTTDDAHTLETDFEVPAPRIIMLTGRPGVGKTTIVRAALDAWTAAGRAAAGFHTREELRDDGRRAGFEIVAADGRRAVASDRSRGATVSARRDDVDAPLLQPTAGRVQACFQRRLDRRLR